MQSHLSSQVIRTSAIAHRCRLVGFRRRMSVPLSTHRRERSGQTDWRSQKGLLEDQCRPYIHDRERHGRNKGTRWFVVDHSKDERYVMIWKKTKQKSFMWA